MTSIKLLLAEQSALRKAALAVADAARTFEARWTLAALCRVDPELHGRFIEQRSLYDSAMLTGDHAAIEAQGAAMCRGWFAAVRAMEAANAADDAYLIGIDPRSGFTVAIGQQKASIERVQQLHGRNVVLITPDEVAALMSSVESFKAIGLIKQMFPGAEVIDVRPHEPAKADGDVE